jgi:hypothetical protein
MISGGRPSGITIGPASGRNAANKLVGHKTDDMYRRYNIESKRDLEEAGKLYAAYMATLPTTDNVISLRRAAEGATQ